jgi:hypothetical protein
VLDALTNPVADVKSVELRNFNLDQLNAQQLDLLLSGCGHECQSFSLEKCTLSGDRFFTLVTETLTRKRVRLAHLRVRRYVVTLVLVKEALNDILVPLAAST